MVALFTVVFPLPVTPITLDQRVNHHPSTMRDVGYTRDECRRIFGVLQERVFCWRPTLKVIGSGESTVSRITIGCEMFEIVLVYWRHVHEDMVVKKVWRSVACQISRRHAC